MAAQHPQAAQAWVQECAQQLVQTWSALERKPHDPDLVAAWRQLRLALFATQGAQRPGCVKRGFPSPRMAVKAGKAHLRRNGQKISSVQTYRCAQHSSDGIEVWHWANQPTSLHAQVRAVEERRSRVEERAGLPEDSDWADEETVQRFLAGVEAIRLAVLRRDREALIRAAAKMVADAPAWMRQLMRRVLNRRAPADVQEWFFDELERAS